MAGISLKFNKINKILKRNGFKLTRVKGDHYIYKRGNDVAVIPYVDCNELLLEKYFKQFNIVR